MADASDVPLDGKIHAGVNNDESGQVGAWESRPGTGTSVVEEIRARMKGPSKIPAEVIWRIMPDNPFRGYVSDRILRGNIEGHQRDCDAWRPDFVKIMSDGFFSHPSIVDHGIARPEDLRRIEPIGPDHPWIRRQVDMVCAIVDHQHGEIMAFANVFAPIQQFRLFIEYVANDVNGFQDMLRDQPEAVARAAEVVADDTIALVEALAAETGVDGAYYSVQSAQRPECDRAHHDRWIRPSDLRVLDRIDELWRHNILHVCGYEGYRNDLAAYADYPASAYNWAVHTEGVSLAEGKEVFDGVVIGGFDNRPGSLLETGTTHEVVEATRRLIDEAGSDGLAISADCTIDADIGLDRLDLIRHVAAEASSG